MIFTMTMLLIMWLILVWVDCACSKVAKRPTRVWELLPGGGIVALILRGRKDG